MTIFQLLAILFAFFMLYVVNIHKKKAALSAFEVGMWFAIWTGFSIIAFFPNLLIGIVHIFHFTRVFDLLIVIAFMILTIIIVMTYFNQKSLNQKIEDYIRHRAINNKIKKSSS